MSIPVFITSVLALIGRLLAYLQARQSIAENNRLNDLLKKAGELEIIKRAMLARKNAQEKLRKGTNSSGDMAINGVQNDKYKRD